MKRRTKTLLKALAAALILASYCSVAIADPFATMFGATKCPQEREMPVDTSTLHPTTTPAIAFDDFPRLCKDHPDAVICAGSLSDKRLTFAEVVKIDAKLRAHFRYRSDDATAGRSDYWRHWTTCGDCEDYALTLSELLARSGEGGAHMGLQFMFVPILPDDLGDPNAQVMWGAHATLWVDTTDKGTVEVSVGYPPQRLVYGYGVRLGMIPMDGSRKALGFGQAVVHDDEHYISMK